MGRMWFASGRIVPIEIGASYYNFSRRHHYRDSNVLWSMYATGYDSYGDEARLLYPATFSNGEIYASRSLLQVISGSPNITNAVAFRATELSSEGVGFPNDRYIVCHHYSSYSVTSRCSLYKNSSSSGNPDSGTQLGNISSCGTNISMRIRAVSTALKVRAWGYGGTEPGSWGIETTDGTYSNGVIYMWMGVTSNYSNNRTSRATFHNGIGVDYGGTSAPTSGGLKTISGNVKRAGVNQSGATVFLIRRGADLTKPLIPGIDIAKATTDSNGNYSVAVDTDAEDWFVVPDYETGGSTYSGYGQRVRWS